MNYNDYHEILIGLVGAVLYAIPSWIWVFTKNHLRNYRFKQLFGSDIKSFHVVYGKMTLNSTISLVNRFPYVKSDTGYNFRVTSPISFSEAKAVRYFSETFFKSVKTSPVIISDEEIKDRLDLSYCSFGGYNNYKSIDVLNSINNRFYYYDLQKPNVIFKKIDPETKFVINQEYDYAVVIKSKNKQFPERIQMCVVGIGEWGTSGGAWFVANNWKKIRKMVGINEFGLIIKVRIGYDESGEIVDLIS